MLMRNRSGPKPKPESERLSRFVLVRMTPVQLAELKQAAGHEPLSTYIRRAALQARTGGGEHDRDRLAARERRRLQRLKSR